MDKVSFAQESPDQEKGFEQHQAEEVSQLQQLKTFIESDDKQSALALLDQIMAGEAEETKMETQEAKPDLASKLDQALAQK